MGQQGTGVQASVGTPWTAMAAVGPLSTRPCPAPRPPRPPWSDCCGPVCVSWPGPKPPMVLTTPWPLRNSLNWYVVGLVCGVGEGVGALLPCCGCCSCRNRLWLWLGHLHSHCCAAGCFFATHPCTLVSSRWHQVLAKYGEDTSRGSYATSPSSSSTLDLTLDILAFKRLCRSVLHGAGADDRVSGDGVG